MQESIQNLLDVQALSCSYTTRDRATNLALKAISFTMPLGQNLGVIGESGSGKSSLIRSLAKLIPSQSQQILFDGKRIDHLSQRDFNPLRKEMQLIFQDPHSAFNPYLPLQRSLREPLHAFPHVVAKPLWQEHIEEMVQEVGLSPSLLQRYPKELSGGMAQRMNIARALLLHPKLILADEPVSALDFVIQAQVIDLMAQLQARYHSHYLIISHSFPIIKALCPQMIILYQGRIVEYGATDAIMQAPIHPYTQQILLATRDPLSQISTKESEATLTHQGETYRFYPDAQAKHFATLAITSNHGVGVYRT